MRNTYEMLNGYHLLGLLNHFIVHCILFLLDDYIRMAGYVLLTRPLPIPMLVCER